MQIGTQTIHIRGDKKTVDRRMFARPHRNRGNQPG
jgi:hypothetical protein